MVPPSFTSQGIGALDRSTILERFIVSVCERSRGRCFDMVYNLWRMMLLWREFVAWADDSMLKMPGTHVTHSSNRIGGREDSP